MTTLCYDSQLTYLTKIRVCCSKPLPPEKTHCMRLHDRGIALFLNLKGMVLQRAPRSENNLLTQMFT